MKLVENRSPIVAMSDTEDDTDYIAEMDQFNHTEWYYRTQEMVTCADPMEVQSFGTDVMAIFGRFALLNNNTHIRVQKGLNYELDSPSLADDLVTGVTGCEVYVSRHSFGENCTIEISAETIDTAEVAIETLPQANTPMQPEITKTVECHYDLVVEISPSTVISDAVLSVSVPS